MKQTKAFRQAALAVRAEEGEERVYLTFSSEAPCPMTVYDAEKQRMVQALEILGHTEEEIDRSRMADGLVVQDNHDGDQIGLIREVVLADGKLGGYVDFCHGARAKEIEADALAGLRRNTSVGYIVNEWKPTGEEVDGVPVYRAISWTPFEASFVNVPADTRVGVNREADISSTAEGETEMAEPIEAPKAEEQPALEEQLAALKSRLDEIADALKPAETEQKEEAEEAQPKPAETEDKPETTPEEAEAENEELKPETEKQEKKMNLFTIKEGERRYNLLNAVRKMAGQKVDAALEEEVSDEIARRTGKSARGLFIPGAALRAFDKGTAAANLVATDTLFDEMVPALVAETVLGKAGVRTLTGLVGDVEIPTAGSATSYWISAEGGDATESTPNIGQVTATPKTIGAYTDITRKLMNQSGVSAQAFIADALRSALGRGIETAAFAGSGSSGQPTGLDNASNVNTIASATTPTLAKVLEFITTIETANAAGPDMKFIGQPAVWGKLGQTLDYTVITASDAAVAGVTSGKYLLDTATNTCQGYDFIKGNLATAKWLYFGDWSKLLLAFWSGLDLTVDTSTLSKSGGVRLVALQDMDVVVTQPAAFARGQVIA